MSFRKKLLLGVLFLICIAEVLVLVLAVLPARRLVFEQIQSKALSIAMTAAAQIDGDVLQELKPGDEETEDYLEIAREMRQIRDASRRKDVQVAYIYTMRPGTDETSSWHYVVDAEEPDSEDWAGVGVDIEFETLGENEPLSEALKRPLVDEWFIEDEYGTWLCASVPILNSAGEPVAVLGLDLDAERVTRQQNAILWRALAALPVAVLVGILMAWILSLLVSRPLEIVREGVIAIGDGKLDTRIDYVGKNEFGMLAGSINTMAEKLEEREMLREAFARYVSRDVADRILEEQALPGLEGTRQKVTVLFSDLRGFTTWAEPLDPEEVVSQLNEYFSAMVKIIFRHHGTLDKFIGDGLMVVFGAPLPDEEQELHAVQALQEMVATMKELGAKWEAEGKSSFRLGVGVHTGMAVVGNIGSEERMEYTAVGRTVNLASRLEAETKRLGVPALISEETVAAVKDQFPFEPMGDIVLRGMSESVSTWTLKMD